MKGVDFEKKREKVECFTAVHHFLEPPGLYLWCFLNGHHPIFHVGLYTVTNEICTTIER